MSQPPDYGIIYNWDGAPHGHHEVPQTMEQFLGSMYAPLEDTQVGANFWCIGEHVARYQSDVLETLGEHVERQYHSAHAYTFDENVLAMIERGEDPQAAAIERGRELGMHVYASVRMNDNHFAGLQVRRSCRRRGTGRLRRCGATIPNGCLATGRRPTGSLCRGIWPSPRCGGTGSSTCGSFASAGTGTESSSTGSVTGTTCTRTTAIRCGMR